MDAETALYYVFQILAAGDYQDDIDGSAPAHRVVYLATVLIGLLVFAAPPPRRSASCFLYCLFGSYSSTPFTVCPL